MLAGVIFCEGAFAMAIHHVELTPELDEFVAQKIASGRYSDASQMVREALEFQKEDDAKMTALEQAIAEGDASGIYEGDAFADILAEFNLPDGMTRTNP